MFEDIIKSKDLDEDTYETETPVVPNYSRNSDMICRDCYFASNVLSNYPGKVLCQKYRRHKGFTQTCSNWHPPKIII